MILCQIPQINIIRVVQQTVWRITDEILEVKGFSSVSHNHEHSARFQGQHLEA